jgi:hypothetical protein
VKALDLRELEQLGQSDVVVGFDATHDHIRESVDLMVSRARIT